MVDSGLAKKLRIKSGQRALILNAPEGYVEDLSPLLEGIQIDQKANGRYEFVQVFVVNSDELNELMATTWEEVADRLPGQAASAVGRK